MSNAGRAPRLSRHCLYAHIAGIDTPAREFDSLKDLCSHLHRLRGDNELCGERCTIHLPDDPMGRDAWRIFIRADEDARPEPLGHVWINGQGWDRLKQELYRQVPPPVHLDIFKTVEAA